MPGTNSNKELATARQEFTLAPGRALDTEVSYKNGVADVLLTLEAANDAAAAIEKALPQWTALYHSPELDLIERRIVERHLGEISLVACATEQLLYDTDNSDEIDSLENELYGYYDPELFWGAVAVKILQVESFDVPAKYELMRRSVITEFMKHTNDHDTLEVATPTEHTLQKVNDWLLDHFGDIVDEIENDPREQFDAGAIALYLQKTIDSTPSLHGWKSQVIERQKNAVSTRAMQQDIVVPSQRMMKRDELKKVNMHEIFHALRSAEAKRLGMSIGQYGTAAYARFEESFMIALEQCLMGKADPMRGVDHYIAIGLSVTGGLSKDKVAELMGSTTFLRLVKKNGEEKAKESADKRAAMIIGRSFAGMTDVDDGIAHRKDIDYYHGLNNAWRLLNFAAKNNVLDETMRWVMSAKFNPLDAADRDYVDQHVAMPAALTNLFEKIV